MPTRNPGIDAYIEKSPEFARPILAHLRELVHAACPDVEETLKWSCPHFQHKGILCNMAAFKAHCSFGFWKHSLIFDGAKGEEKDGAGSFGKITSLKDLPKDKELIGHIKKAAKLNEEGIKLPSGRKPKARPEATVPDDLAAALRKNAAARKAFEAFSPSHRREYIEWITEAKTEPTRAKRLATTLEWLAEGKSRNWKYQNC
ncbi:MAG TPA: YdeI/OmpD-associated family protein [Verrucomicrobiae bacterium]|nr:YdeI/OmpD-associated family protein [Verrucomicrobiae bacterium]